MATNKEKNNGFLTQQLLSKAEEEFGFDHPMGLTISCRNLH
jgi:hypothetical protein